MPIIVTYDVQDADTNQRNRVQEFFEKLGWQRLGGTAYRYPPLDSGQINEDWLNVVVPALMLFRKYLLSSPRIKLTRFSIDVQSSTGYDRDLAVGQPARVIDANGLTATATNKFTVAKLVNWLNSEDYPYPR